MTPTARAKQTKARRRLAQQCIDCGVDLAQAHPLRCLPCRRKQSVYMARYYQRMVRKQAA